MDSMRSVKISRIVALGLVVMLLVGVVPGGIGLWRVFGDYYSDGGGYEPIVPSSTAVYLEEGIGGTGLSGIHPYPSSGTFTMGGTLFTRGIRSTENFWGASVSSVTYNLTDRGFTRLSGMFGRVSGTGTGALLITDAESGRFIHAQTFSNETPLVSVDAALPQGVGHILIRIISHTANNSFGFGNAYFIADDTSIPFSNAVYIPCDILAAYSSGLLFFPDSDSFAMGGVSYFRGMRTNNGFWGSEDGIAIFNIEGRGFTRLSGVFGRANGTGSGALVVKADNRLIFGHPFDHVAGAAHLDIPIPPGAQEIHIRLQVNAADTNFGFGNVYFYTDDTQPPPSTGNVYLESDIFGVSSAGLIYYPRSGSFIMHGITYFRGVTTDNGFWTSNDGTITYDIADRGFVRLSGVFGSINGFGGSLEIYGDNISLLSHTFVQGNAPRRIDVVIPPGTRQVTIQLRVTSSGANFAFGEAFFARPIPGDVNRDWQVTAADVGLLRAYLAGFPVEICREAADVNNDGQITAADVGLLRAYLAGFPVRLGPER